MIPLESNDYEMLLASILDLHAFRDRISLRSWLLDEALQRLIPCDLLSYNEVDLLNPANTLAILKPESNAFVQEFFPRFQALAHQHPLITRQLHSPDFSVHKSPIICRANPFTGWHCIGKCIGPWASNFKSPLPSNLSRIA